MLACIFSRFHSRQRTATESAGGDRQSLIVDLARRLLFRDQLNFRAAAFFCLGQARASLAIVDDESVVLTQLRPRSARDIFEIHELPIGDVGLAYTKVIAHGRRHIETRAAIQGWVRPFVAENLLPVIGAKRSRVLPLR